MITDTVHPHTRGEYGQNWTAEEISNGSPPHTWGILLLLGIGTYVMRFTPTHVGNTRLALASAAALSVHPHTRGEYFRVPLQAETASGSPPHTWGIPGTWREILLQSRFTPTHVGNTMHPQTPGGHRPVHPHTRGEYSEILCLTPFGLMPGYSVSVSAFSLLLTMLSVAWFF